MGLVKGKLSEGPIRSASDLIKSNCPSSVSSIHLLSASLNFSFLISRIKRKFKSI